MSDRHHNQPPLADRLAMEHADLAAQAKDAAELIPSDLSEITSDQEAANYTEAAAGLKKIMAEADRAFKVAKQPWLDGGREVDKFFAGLRAPLSGAAARLITAIGRWQDAKRTAQKRAEAEAAAKAAAEATPFDDEEPFIPPPAAAKDVVRVVTSSGAKASGTVRWLYRVVDPDKIPREFLKLNDELVTATVKGLKAHGGAIEAAKDTIPGIEIYEHIQTSIR